MKAHFLAAWLLAQEDVDVVIEDTSVGFCNPSAWFIKGREESPAFIVLDTDGGRWCPQPDCEGEDENGDECECSEEGEDEDEGA